MAKHINSIVITEIESNTRLDRYLVNSLNIPQGLVQKDLRKGLIRVNEKKISGSYRIQEEDIIQFAKEYSENKPKEKILPNKKDLGLLKKSIIYSCDDFFIIHDVRFLEHLLHELYLVRVGQRIFLRVI